MLLLLVSGRAWSALPWTASLEGLRWLRQRSESPRWTGSPNLPLKRVEICWTAPKAIQRVELRDIELLRYLTFFVCVCVCLMFCCFDWRHTKHGKGVEEAGVNLRNYMQLFPGISSKKQLLYLYMYCISYYIYEYHTTVYTHMHNVSTF